MRKDIRWPAATCIAVVLAITATISLRGQHGEGKREEIQGEAWLDDATLKAAH